MSVLTSWLSRSSLLCMAITVCGCGALLGACGGGSSERRSETSIQAPISNGDLREPNARQRREIAEDEHQKRRVAELEQLPPELTARGARLVQEAFTGQLGAWQDFYQRVFGGAVRELWRSDGQRVSLEYRAITSGRSSGRAEWSVLSPSAGAYLSVGQLIHPQNQLARRFQTLPSPHTGTSYPVLLLAVELLTPGQRVAAVVLSPQREYQPVMFATAGAFDESLLRGYGLAHQLVVSPRVTYLAVARDAAIYRSTITHGRIGALTPASFKALREAFSQGLVPLLVGWRHGASRVSTLLAEPVQTLIVLEPASS